MRTEITTWDNASRGARPAGNIRKPYANKVTITLGERELIYPDLATSGDLKRPHVPLYR
ncbi:hypothetical protein J8I87_30170 [Paraburkholderia sp. LEh10]|uniref:hypothetical protein n=1 Tax=Paraburkholderia sp. LEh10 TaxID=2821353 RepID=UPI001AE452A0|nr:hypothetical protein [Paraburkholderia sp. LEh10]MBP0593873.1 hypothetical protein [Paraburkholderia sp. LEh10]